MKNMILAFNSLLLLCACSTGYNPAFDNYSAYSVDAAHGDLVIETRGLRSLDLGGGFEVDMPHEMVKGVEKMVAGLGVQVEMPEELERKFWERPKTGRARYRVMIFYMRGTYKDRPTYDKLIYGMNISDPSLANYDALREYRFTETFEDEKICTGLSPAQCKEKVSDIVLKEVAPRLKSFLRDFDYLK